MTFVEKVADAKALVKESLEKYPKITVGCSFGKDSMTLLHLVRSVSVDVPVFSLLADTEFQETYDFEKRMVAQWNIKNYQRYIFTQESTDVASCCGAPKIEIAKKAVEGLDAWISGVRKTEGITRVDFQYIEEKNGLVKVNPILDFTELDVWRYLAVNNVPVNPKYSEGFRSLGCARCSFPEEDENESERAGRWKGTTKVCGECGIHTQPLR
ncbi:phosphoadenosine phosphosulfate reductase family protein [Candidatus Uhrbacteria bacterium]|nr:phosphoadenosine phosphosulfate reductase family protein [Candidatus Uhrbacteria bacterium]